MFIYWLVIVVMMIVDVAGICFYASVHYAVLLAIVQLITTVLTVINVIIIIVCYIYMIFFIVIVTIVINNIGIVTFIFI